MAKRNTTPVATTITDPAEDAALVAARAYYTAARAGGYASYVTEALTAIERQDLVSGTGYPVTFDMDKLFDLARDVLSKVAIRVTEADATAYTVAEAAYRPFGHLGLRDTIYQAISDGTVSFTIEATESAFDPDALLAKYGNSGDLPTPDGEQAEAITVQRRAMAEAFLTVADRHTLCSTFDEYFESAGLAPYAPPRQAEVSTEVEGIGTVTTTVPLSRAGKITDRDLASYLRQAVNKVWEDRALASVKAGKVTGLPVTSA